MFTKSGKLPPRKPTPPRAFKVPSSRSGRERIRRSLVDRETRANSAPIRTSLTRERLRAIAALPHVERSFRASGTADSSCWGSGRKRFRRSRCARTTRSGAPRIVAGRFFRTPDQRAVVVTEFLAYRLGLDNDADIDGLVGKTLRLEFRTPRSVPGIVVSLNNPRGTLSPAQVSTLQRVSKSLPEGLEKLGVAPADAEILRKALCVSGPAGPEILAEELPIVGVLRRPTDAETKEPRWEPLNEAADVFLPYETAADIYFRAPGTDERAIGWAVVMVDAEEHVKEVARKIGALGLRSHAPVEFIDRERLMFLLIFAAMACVAGVALLVAALGIANTMLMSVLERTREIGIMKAVGADNRHLLVIFLVEGALIGLIGGASGWLLAWSASYPADTWVHEMVQRDLNIKLTGSIFEFSPALAGAVIGFTVLVTTLAAVYPALHAARIDPVKALRHE